MLTGKQRVEQEIKEQRSEKKKSAASPCSRGVSALHDGQIKKMKKQNKNSSRAIVGGSKVKLGLQNFLSM